MPSFNPDSTIAYLTLWLPTGFVLCLIARGHHPHAPVWAGIVWGAPYLATLVYVAAPEIALIAVCILAAPFRVARWLWANPPLALTR